VVYAVGDIHGRLDLLQGAIQEIERGAKGVGDGNQVTAVFLGDYIDRGPSARGVIDRLIELRAAKPCELLFLRGNHEQFLLDMIDGQAEGAAWLDYGGIETLRSYGVDWSPAGGRDIKRLGEKLRAAVPPAHLGFLRETELHVERGDYVFVHAGLRPDRLLSEQSDADMLWFRYYSDDEPLHGKTVVHGHTPRARPVAGRWRIGIDTEAYDSGALTVVRLEGTSADFLKVQVAPGDGQTRVSEWELVDRPNDQAEAGEPRRDPAPRSERPERPRANFGRGGLMAAGAVAVAAVMVVGVLVGLAVWIKSRDGDAIPVRPGAAASPPIASIPSPVLAAPTGAAPAVPGAASNTAAPAKPMTLAAKAASPEATAIVPTSPAPGETAAPGATGSSTPSPSATPPGTPPSTAATADAAPIRTAPAPDATPASPTAAPGPAN
jgi:serine/threonine protein phosphatase 1